MSRNRAIVNEGEVNNPLGGNTEMTDITDAQNSQSFAPLPKITLSDAATQRVSDVPTNSSSQLFFLLVNTMIGSGILNMPEVMSQAGFLGGVIMLTVVAMVTWYAVSCVVNATVILGETSYQNAMRRSFGAIGEKVFLASILILNLGALMSYITILGGTASQLFLSWDCEDDFCEVNGTTSFLVMCFVVPVCLYRHYGHLSLISTFSFVAIGLCVLFVVIAGPILGPQSDAGPVLILEMEGLIRKLGSCVFALSFASSCIMGYRSMDESQRTPEHFNIVSAFGVATGMILCIVMGISGYNAFRGDTDGEILDNFETHAADPFKFLLAVHMVLYIPVDAVVLRDAANQLCFSLGDQEELTLIPHVCITLFLVGMCLATVLGLRSAGLSKGEAFSIILDLTGSVAGSMVTFILPAALYMRAMDVASDDSGMTPSLLTTFLSTAPEKRAPAVLLVFGIFVLITVPTVIFLDA